MNSLSSSINDIACVNIFEGVLFKQHQNICDARTSQKALHSMTMFLEVRGHWEVTHRGSSSPDKWKCRQLSKSLRKYDDIWNA